MKIAIISTIIYPSKLANRIHLIEMATAFAKNGCEVDLLCRQVTEPDLEKLVKITQLGTKKSFWSALKFVQYLKKEPKDFWFCREPHLLLQCIVFYTLLNWKKPPYILYEVHDMPRDFLDGLVFWALLRIGRFKIITITHSLARDIKSQYNIPEDKIMVLPDGVNFEKFGETTTKTEAREKLQISQTAKVVAYTGSFFEWKGVYTLLEVAKEIKDGTFVFVGGNEKDLPKFKEAAKGLDNVIIHGHVPHREVSVFLTAADVLVLPNSAKERMSNLYTSPLKLFEYMAMKRPVVASSLPSIKEILEDGRNAFLVEPDDVVALKTGVEKALTSSRSKEVADQAFSDVQNYSWDERVKMITNAV